MWRSFFVVIVLYGGLVCCSGAYGQQNQNVPQPEFAMEGSGFNLTVPPDSDPPPSVVFNHHQYVERPAIPNNEYQIYRRDEDLTRDIFRERVIEKVPSLCLISPIPVDHRFVGCVLHFEPQDATIDQWN